jgi:DNA-binding transcriptional ArsR family regulator
MSQSPVGTILAFSTMRMTQRWGGLLIAEKLQITQPTASEHLRILSDAGLLKSKKIKQWIFYKRDAEGIRRAHRSLTEVL